jgi:hypothetical protein
MMVDVAANNGYFEYEETSAAVEALSLKIFFSYCKTFANSSGFSSISSVMLSLNTTTVAWLSALK